MKHKWFLVLACAWVLWSSTSTSKFGAGDISPGSAYESRADCINAIDRLLANRGESKEGEKITSTRDDTTGVKMVTGKDIYANDYFIIFNYRCYPSDFDPREKAAR